MKTDFRCVELKNGFWKRYWDINRTVTVNTVYDQFYESGRIDALSCDEELAAKRKPHVYWDSDVAKWAEGAAYIIFRDKSGNTGQRLGEIIDSIEKNQLEDGYFNSYYEVCEQDMRLTDRSNHELYCAGHIMEAAVAYYMATGKADFLDAAEKYADFIDREFRTNKAERSFITPGHPELELALMRLSEATGKRKYAELAKFFIDERANNSIDTVIHKSAVYAQDNVPLRKMKNAAGHAVRCLYLLCAMADVAESFEDEELMNACRRTYSDIVNTKMYITGGVGSSRIGEAFTLPYDLPGKSAYAETCAAIALMMFADRMCRIEKKACYADTVERAMYNGMLSGISLKGDSFFYENPLEINLRNYVRESVKDGEEILPLTQRVHLFECSCCPPNLVRTIAGIGGYAYNADGEDCYVNQFMDSSFRYNGMSVTQKTGYPTGNTAEITCEGVKRLFVRIPGWCRNYSFSQPYTEKDGYAVFEKPAEPIVFSMDMSPALIEACPEVYNITGKCAVQAGPVVYCAEAVDNCENLHALYISNTPNFQREYDELFGTDVITADAYKKRGGTELYREVTDDFEETKIRLIPYYGFANRGKCNMLVWLNHR